MIRKEIKDWFESQNMIMGELDIFWLDDLVGFLEKREIALLDQSPTILVDVPNGPPIDFVRNFTWKIYDNEDWENTSRSYLDFHLAIPYACSLLANSKGRVVVDFVNESLFSLPKGAKFISNEVYKKMQLLDDNLLQAKKNDNRKQINSTERGKL